MMQRVVEANRKKIYTPFFAPSISGVALQRMPRLFPYLIESIKRTNFPALMFSIYDLMSDVNLLKWSKSIFDKGSSVHRSFNLHPDTIVFLDSGGFEASSYGRLESWNDPLHVYASQNLAKGDVWIILDQPTHRNLNKKENDQRIKRTIEFARLVSNVHSADIPLVACAHGYDRKSLFNCVEELLKLNKIAGIAIPAKREPFNESAVGKMESIFGIKEIIQNKNPRVFLHLLGCGSLRKWPLYALCGADSMDATNWLAYVAHPIELTWKKYSIPIKLKCTCWECKKHPQMTLDQVCSQGPVHRLSHNLSFAQALVEQIQQSIQEETLQQLAQKYEPRTYARLNAHLHF